MCLEQNLVHYIFSHVDFYNFTNARPLDITVTNVGLVGGLYMSTGLT